MTQRRRRSRSVDLRTLRFGIEIETVGVSRQELAEAVWRIVGGRIRTIRGRYEVVADDQRVWQVVHDGSLTSENFSGEVVSPILAYSDIPELQRVVRALRHRGARVDRSCGLHIHVDASGFDAPALCHLVKMVNKQQELIEYAFGVRTRRRWCSGVNENFLGAIEARRPRTLDALNVAWYGRRTLHPGHYHPTRYHGVNLHAVWDHGTVEFRWFESTTHAGKVKAYLQFVLALCARAQSTQRTQSKRRPFQPESAKYDFRVFLLRLGLIGDEFKTARKHLLARMPGLAAWKRPRQAKRPTTPTSDEPHSPAVAA